MRLYIQEQKKLIKFNLPSKIDGSLLFSYRGENDTIDNTVNIDSANNQWILKSNGSMNIVGKDMFIPQVVLSDYCCIPIQILSRNEIVYLFCLPSVEESLLTYNSNASTTITIGSDANNNIIYNQSMMFPQHCLIQKKENLWEISPQTNATNCFIYVNSVRVLTPTKLHAGDVIFINGLRVIWMQDFFEVTINQNMFRTAGLSIFGNKGTINNKEYTEVNETESNIDLYREDEYFSHTPRIRSILETEDISIEAPPSKESKENDMPFLLSIGSSFSMLGMSMMNAYSVVTNIQQGEKIETQIPAIVTLVTMIFGSMFIPMLTKRWQKKLGIRREKLRQTKYSEYLKNKEEEIQAILKKQASIITENNVSLKECLENLKSKNRNIWNRKIIDDDFLNVRLGFGDRPAFLKIDAPKEKFTLDDDNLYQMVCKVREKYDTLENIPITINLTEEIVTALILYSHFDRSYINALMLQLTTYHSPLDLKIVILTSKSNEEMWNFAKYIPHCWNDERTVRYFSSSQDELKTNLTNLEEEYELRIEKRKEKQAEEKEIKKNQSENYALYEPYYLIITDNFRSMQGHKFIDSLLENEINYGFSILTIENNMKHLPKECQKFININDNESGIFSGKLTESNVIKFKAEYDESINMREVATMLNNIPVQGKDAEHQLPPALSFLEMYNVGKIEQLNIRNRWASSEPMQSLKTPVGVHKNGENFYLDLHEKFDGPHGLIAGSTGSGKSEFIITYILSMAINYDPKEVQFVLIDYKGGGLAGAFENREQGISIPHLAGTITNLDTAEMNRTLVSINSELKRRQKKFNEVREKLGESTMDIYKYQRLFREGVIEEPISHLFIISDEFAELKSQQPEFMNELISTARIGRSLGVHLILATQKPSGVVNDQIWSNSKFKVCLKVQSKADSMEMLKRPEAASIKETGRFYLQVGYDEYFDIGQSAWSGAKYQPAERIIKKIDDSICFVNNCGGTIKRVNDTLKQDKKVQDFGDQLTNIVRYLNQISQADGFKIQKLWLPALSKVMNLSDVMQKYSYNDVENSLTAVVGEYDAPKNQNQGILTVDMLNTGNILIYGNPGAGKDNLISTIIYSLSTHCSPKKVNIYVGDFGAETLKMFQHFPQVGDVFVTEEKNKLDSLLKMLSKEVERRKKEYSDYGGNYVEYCKLSGKEEPVIIVALNNYENFVETYSRNQDDFVQYFRDGYKYGINFIVSTSVSSVIRSRVSQNFQIKICLNMPDSNSYRDLLGSPKGLIPTDNYGRGIIAIENNEPVEFQTANISSREDRTKFLKDMAQQLSIKYNNLKAKGIPVLPETVYVENVIYELKGIDCVPIGIEKNSLEVYVYNFMENKINIIAAKSMKNHIYFVYALIKQMITLKNIKIHIIDLMGIYREKYEGVINHKDDVEKGFIEAYNNVQHDQEQKETNVYFFLGISEIREKLKDKYEQYFETLFSVVNKCKNNTFIFLDNAEGYKKLQVENWYKNNITNTYGIWLGEDVGVQVALGIMSLSIEDKRNTFPCIGYPVYKGNHMIIKYVVDGVERKDEE